MSSIPAPSFPNATQLNDTQPSATQPSSTRRGVVTEFDEPVGLGSVREADGTEHPFHCTAVADGSRDIPVGSEVTFRLMAGRLGRMEATDLCPA